MRPTRTCCSSRNADRSVPPAPKNVPKRHRRAKKQSRGGRMSNARWQNVCALDDLIQGTGVCALVGGRQIAVFQVDGQTTRSTTSTRRAAPTCCRAGSPAICRTNAWSHRPSTSIISRSRAGAASRIRPSTSPPMPRASPTDACSVEAPRDAAPHAPGRRRQRHGRHAHGRRAAEARRRRPLLDHRVRRRAARQLQPHPALAGALR